MPPPAAEIDATAFEQELRAGRALAVLDVRDPAAFAAWRVAAPGATVLNLPEDDVHDDVEGALAALPSGRAVRVICNVGNMSLRVAALLTGRAPDVRSVRGGMVGWSRVLQASPIPVGGPVAVTQFRREARGCLSYLLVAGGEALVVDPAPASSRCGPVRRCTCPRPPWRAASATPGTWCRCPTATRLRSARPP